MFRSFYLTRKNILVVMMMAGLWFDPVNSVLAAGTNTAAPSPLAAPAPSPSSPMGGNSESQIAVNSSEVATLNADAATAIAEEISSRSLIPLITDIPSTFTFRTSCIKKTYIDGFYKRQLNAPKLVRNGNGVYTLYATCLNGLGVPVDTKIKLKLIVRHIGEIRTISIRSIVDSTKRYRNCADIANGNGVLMCIPAKKKSK